VVAPVVIGSLLLVAIALGYVFSRGSDAPGVPRSQRIAVLEQAKAGGFIDDYEVVAYGLYGMREYLADEAVRLVYFANRFGPHWYFLSYPVDESAKPRAIARLARRTGNKVVVAPPYST
jgi:hypothetical protein